jgi:anti-sigma B factor antagonist
MATGHRRPAALLLQADGHQVGGETDEGGGGEERQAAQVGWTAGPQVPGALAELGRTPRSRWLAMTTAVDLRSPVRCSRSGRTPIRCYTVLTRIAIRSWLAEQCVQDPVTPDRHRRVGLCSVRGQEDGSMGTAEAPERLLLEYRLDSGIAVVSVTGEVDVSTCGVLREGLLRVVTDENYRGMVVNLAGVNFIDSTGFGVLVGVWHRVAATKFSLALAAPSRRARDVLDSTGLTKAFSVYDTEAEAVQACCQSAAG